MRACGVQTFEQYAERLQDDATEYDRLLETLTINVTKFYRNADTWDRLATAVLPDLLARRDGRVCREPGQGGGRKLSGSGVRRDARRVDRPVLQP
jgi:hypothetical protein